MPIIQMIGAIAGFAVLILAVYVGLKAANKGHGGLGLLCFILLVIGGQVIHDSLNNSFECSSCNPDKPLISVDIGGDLNEGDVKNREGVCSLCGQKKKEITQPAVE